MTMPPCGGRCLPGDEPPSAGHLRNRRDLRQQPLALRLWGSGSSPRDLILSEAPSVLVIETDLPGMIAEKQAIVASLLPFAARTDYRLHAANALHNDELWDAAGWFGREPLTIVHEGLLMYFDAVERAPLPCTSGSGSSPSTKWGEGSAVSARARSR